MLAYFIIYYHKYIHIYYKKLTFMKTYTHKHLGAIHGAICSQEKCKQTYRRTSNHNCTVNFMQVYTTIIIL